VDFPSKITIAGVGLIGGSLGMILRNLEDPPEIVGFGHRQSTLDTAIARGAIDWGTTDLAAAVEGTDLLIICTPVRRIIPLLKEASANLKSGCIVTDVGSTKKYLVEEAERVIGDGVHFVGGHPMAGSEMTGIDSATPNLFRGAFYILTPTYLTESGPLSVMQQLAGHCGARVVSLSPDVHDAMMATISHMPHMVSSALVNAASQAQDMRAEADLLALAAGGFRDMTRIAASSADVWVDICMTNRSETVKAIESFMVHLGDISDAIDGGDEGSLRRLLDSARELRAVLPGSIPAEEVSVRLRVLIPDRPGVVSEVTNIVGQNGLNVLDLELLHLKDGDEAVLELSFSSESALRTAESVLRDNGYYSSLISR